MNWNEYNVTNNEISFGKLVIKGTRLSVEHILNLLESGWSIDTILENYPRLTKESLQAVIAYNEQTNCHYCTSDENKEAILEGQSQIKNGDFIYHEKLQRKFKNGWKNNFLSMFDFLEFRN